MTKCALVSVVLPVYNGSEFLSDAINSVLNQSYSNFELIILDDGSKDSTLAIAENYQRTDSRIRIITRENRGLSKSLNESIEAANGEWIARMDHDDICMPNRLSAQMKFIEQHPEVVALGTAAIFMDANGNSICQYSPKAEHEQIISSLPGSPFIHPSTLFKKSVYIKARKYPEYMKHGAEDAILFGRMSAFGKLANLKEAHLKYRLVPSSASRKPAAFRAILLKITKIALENKTIDNELLIELDKRSKRINKAKALADYHFELAKLYLWSGGDRRKVRSHLKKCTKKITMWPKLSVLTLLSFFPSNFVAYLYSNAKKTQLSKI